MFEKNKEKMKEKNGAGQSASFCDCCSNPLVFDRCADYWNANDESASRCNRRSKETDRTGRCQCSEDT